MSIEDILARNYNRVQKATEKTASQQYEEKLDQGTAGVSKLYQIARGYNQDGYNGADGDLTWKQNLGRFLTRPESTLETLLQGADTGSALAAGVYQTANLIQGVDRLLNDDTADIVRTGQTKSAFQRLTERTSAGATLVGRALDKPLSEEQQGKITAQIKKYEEAQHLRNFLTYDLDRKVSIGEYTPEVAQSVREQLQAKIDALETENPELAEFVSPEARQRLRENVAEFSQTANTNAQDFKYGGGIKQDLVNWRVTTKQNADEEYQALKARQRELSEKEPYSADWFFATGEVLLRNIKDHGAEILSDPAALADFVGEQLPFLASGGVGAVGARALGVSTKLGSSAGLLASSGADGLRMYSETLREFLLEHGRAPTEAETMGLRLAAVGYTALNYVSDGFILKQLKATGGGIKGIVADTVKRTAAAGLAEGVTEGAQNVLEQQGRKFVNWEEVGQSAAVGGIVGGTVSGAFQVPGAALGVIGGTVDTAQKVARNRQTQKTDQVAQAEELSKANADINNTLNERASVQTELNQAMADKTSLEDDMKSDTYKNDPAFKQMVDEYYAAVNLTISELEEQLANMPEEEVIAQQAAANTAQSLQNAQDYIDKLRKNSASFPQEIQDIFLSPRKRKPEDLRKIAETLPEGQKEMLNFLADIQTMDDVSAEIATKGNSRNALPSLEDYLSEIGLLLQNPAMRQAAEAKMRQFAAFQDGMRAKNDAFQAAYAEAQQTGKPVFINENYERVNSRKEAKWTIHRKSEKLVNAVASDLALIDGAEQSLVKAFNDAIDPSQAAPIVTPQPGVKRSTNEIGEAIKQRKTVPTDTLEDIVKGSNSLDNASYDGTTHAFKANARGQNINQPSSADSTVLVQSINDSNIDVLKQSISNRATIIANRAVSDNQEITDLLRKTHRVEDGKWVYDDAIAKQNKPTKQTKPKQKKTANVPDKSDFTGSPHKDANVRKWAEAQLGKDEIQTASSWLVGWFVSHNYVVSKFDTKTGKYTLKPDTSRVADDATVNYQGKKSKTPIRKYPGVEQAKRIASNPLVKGLWTAIPEHLPTRVREYLANFNVVKTSELKTNDVVVIPEQFLTDRLKADIEKLINNGVAIVITNSTSASVGLENFSTPLRQFIQSLNAEKIEDPNFGVMYVHSKNFNTFLAKITDAQPNEAIPVEEEQSQNATESSQTDDNADTGTETQTEPKNQPEEQREGTRAKPWSLSRDVKLIVNKIKSRAKSFHISFTEDQKERFKNFVSYAYKNGYTVTQSAASGVTTVLVTLKEQTKKASESKPTSDKVTLTHRQGVSNALYAKDQAKANVADGFIGFGVQGSSTALYAQDFRNAGLPVNPTTYKSGKTYFASVNGGKRATQENVAKTIEAIRAALDAGATVVLDREANTKGYNATGEGAVRTALSNLGYAVEERKGEPFARWTKPEESQEEATQTVPEENVAQKPSKSPVETISEPTPSTPTIEPTETAVEAMEKATLDPTNIVEAKTEREAQAEQDFEENKEKGATQAKNRYNRLNRIKSFFKVVPTALSTIGNYFSNVMLQKDTPQGLAQQLGRELTDQDLIALRDFAKFRKNMDASVRSDLKANLKNPNSLIKEMLNETGEATENLVTAIISGMYDYVVNAGRNGKPTDEDVREMVGLEKNDEVSKEALNILRNAGNLRNNVYRQIGQQIYDRLGLQLLENGQYNDNGLLAASLGAIAVNSLEAYDMVQVTEMNVQQQYNLYRALNLGTQFAARYTDEILKHAKASQLEEGALVKVFEEMLDKGLLKNNHAKAYYVRPNTDYNENFELTSPSKTLLNAVNNNKGTDVIAEIFDGINATRLPSDKPRNFTQEFAKGTTQVIPEKVKKALEANNTREWITRNDLIEGLDKVREEDKSFFQELLGIPADIEKVLNETHVERRDDVKAGWDAKIRDYDNMLDWFKGRTNKLNPVYLSTVLWKNIRYGYREAINPQSSILHRQMMGMESWTVTVNPNEKFFNEDETITTKSLWARAVAEGMEGHTKELGYHKLSHKSTVDKVEPEIFMKPFMDLIHSEEIKTAALAFAKILNKEALTQEDKAAIREFIAKADTDMAALGSLHQLALYHTSGGKPFKTNISKSSDGINNGPISTYLALGAADEKVLNQGGISFDGSTAFKHIATKKDLYEEQAEIEGRELARVSSSYRWAEGVAAIQALSAKYGLRAYAKKSVIPFNYSAGMASIVRALQAAFFEDMQGKLEDAYKLQQRIAEEPNNKKLKKDLYTIINQYNRVIEIAANINYTLAEDVRTIKQKTEDEVVDLYEWLYEIKHPDKEFSIEKLYKETGLVTEDLIKRIRGMASDIRHINTKQIEAAYISPDTDFLNVRIPFPVQQAIKNLIAGTRGKATAAGLQSNQAYMEGRTALTTLTSTAFTIFKLKFQRELANRIQASQDRGYPLTKAEFEQFLKDMSVYIPTTRSPQDIELQITKWATDYVNFTDFGSMEVNLTPAAGSKSKSTKIWTNDKTPSDPGVLISPLMIQSLDAFVTTLVTEEFEAINQHDANGFSLDDYTKGVTAQNRAYWKGITANSLALEAVRTLSKLSDAFLDDNFGVTPKELAEALNRGPLTEDRETLNNLLEKIDKSLTILRTAEVTRQALITQMETVHQYGGEYGQYHPTAEDKAAIKDVFEEIDEQMRTAEFPIIGLKSALSRAILESKEDSKQQRIDNMRKKIASYQMEEPINQAVEEVATKENTREEKAQAKATLKEIIQNRIAEETTEVPPSAIEQTLLARYGSIFSRQTGKVHTTVSRNPLGGRYSSGLMNILGQAKLNPSEGFKKAYKQLQNVLEGIRKTGDTKSELVNSILNEELFSPEEKAMYLLADKAIRDELASYKDKTFLGRLKGAFTKLVGIALGKEAGFDKLLAESVMHLVEQSQAPMSERSQIALEDFQEATDTFVDEGLGKLLGNGPVKATEALGGVLKALKDRGFRKNSPQAYYWNRAVQLMDALKSNKGIQIMYVNSPSSLDSLMKLMGTTNHSDLANKLTEYARKGDSLFHAPSNTVIMFSPAYAGVSAATVPVLLHELTHAVSAKNIEGKAALKQDIQNLMDTLQETLPELKDSYSFTSPHEFIADMATLQSLYTAIRKVDPILATRVDGLFQQATIEQQDSSSQTELDLGNDFHRSPTNRGITTPSNYFEQLDQTDNQDLREFIASTVDPFMGILEPGLLAGVTSTTAGSWALALNRTPYVFDALGAGYQLDEAQQYAAEIIEVAMRHFLKNNPDSIATRELLNTFHDARKTLKPEDFYQGDWSTASAWDQRIARTKYNHVFNLTNTQNNGEFLARFAALSATSPELKTLLDRQALSYTQDEVTGFDYLTKWFNEAVAWVMDKKTKTSSKHKTIDENITNLVYELASIQEKANSQSFFDSIDRGLDSLDGLLSNAALPQSIEKNLRKLERSGNAFGKIIQTARHFDLQIAMELFAGTRNVQFAQQELGVFSSIMNELRTTTNTNRVMQGMLRATKALEKTRDDHISATEVVLYKHFLAQDKIEKNPEYQKVLTNTFLRTNAQELLSAYGLDTLTEFMTISDALKAEIELYANRVRSASPNAIRVNRAKQLAWYMVSGQATPLLAKNAKAIAEDVGLELQSPSNKELEADIERLVSLQAFEYATQRLKYEDRAKIISEMQREDNGVLAMLRIHRDLVNDSKTVFMDSPYNYQMGWLPEITNKYKSIFIAPVSQREELEKKGYVFSSEIERDPSDLSKDDMALYINPDNGLQRMVSGAINIAEGSKKGTMVTERGSKEFQQISSKVQKDGIATLLDERFDPLDFKGSYLVPSYTHTGQISSLSYEMTHYGRDTLLSRNNDFGRLLGAMAGRVFDRSTQQGQNEAVVDALIKDYQDNFNKNRSAYVHIAPNASTERGRTIWKSLPYATQQAIIERQGEASLWASNEILDMVFGYVVPSAAKWAENAEQGEKVKAMVVYEFLNALFGGKTRLRVAQIERVWQELVANFKNYIVIRNLYTAVGNIVSNAGLLMAHGVNPAYMAKKIGEATKLGLQYKKDKTALIRAETEYAITPTPELRTQIESLKFALKNNTAARWIEEFNLLPSIVEDAALLSNNYEYKSPFTESIDGWVDKYLPETAQKALNTLLVAPDTPIYKFLNEATQQGDFVAKYTLMSYYLDKRGYRSEYGINAELMAAERANEVFINYDIPLNSKIEYLNRMGILMFSKYRIRIQKALFRLAKERPAQALLIGTLMGYAFDKSFLGEMFLARLGNPFSFAPIAVTGMFNEPIVINSLLGTLD